MDSSRLESTEQARKQEKMDHYMKIFMEHLSSQTVACKALKESQERSKKELEKSIAKNTGLLVKAFTNPELSDLQMKIANSITGKERVEKRIMKLEDAIQGFNSIAQMIERASPIRNWDLIKGLCEDSGIEIPENVIFEMGSP